MVSKKDLSAALMGAALALAGALSVEAAVRGGFAPFSPLGIPGIAAIAAGALAGVWAFAAGGTVVVAYYFINAAHAERFPQFFSGYWPSAAWSTALLVLGVLVLWMRSRMQRAEAAAAYDQGLRESEAHFRSLTELSSDYYWEQDENFRFVSRIGSPEGRGGYRVDQVLGKTRWELPSLNMTEADWARHRADLEAHREFRALVIHRPTPDGSSRWISTSGRPMFDDAGRFTGYRGVGRDVTAEVRARNDLAAARERLEQALDGSSVAMWDTDLRTGRVYLSEAWSDIVGAPRAESVVTTTELHALLHPDDVEPVRRVSVETFKGLRPLYAVEHRVRALSGDWKWVLSRGRVTERDPRTGRALRMVGTNLDITDRKRIEEAMRSVAENDPLTGLATRVVLGERIRAALARNRRVGACVALFYLDIDRFKKINDSLGHAAGDTLLRVFAQRLKACVRASDTVARIGGDEFVIVLDDVKERDNALQIANKVIEAVRAPVEVDGRSVEMTTSIGIAYAEADERDDALIKRADQALYDAKAAGRNAFRIAARLAA